MRALTGLVALLLLVSCADDESEATPTVPLVTFVATDCPVEDEAFCAVATEAINALAARDADELLSVSRADRIECAEMAVEYFPGCASDDVIEGFGVSGPSLVVNLVTDAEYLVHLRGTTQELEPASVQMLGVGSCGPNSPGRRTYHVSWTGMVVDTDRTAIPILGSFEFNFVDNWRIVLFYVGTLDSWQEAQDDPLHNAFCEAGQTPWLN